MVQGFYREILRSTDWAPFGAESLVTNQLIASWVGVSYLAGGSACFLLCLASDIGSRVAGSIPVARSGVQLCRVPH